MISAAHSFASSFSAINRSFSQRTASLLVQQRFRPYLRLKIRETDHEQHTKECTTTLCAMKIVKSVFFKSNIITLMSVTLSPNVYNQQIQRQLPVTPEHYLTSCDQGKDGRCEPSVLLKPGLAVLFFLLLINCA